MGPRYHDAGLRPRYDNRDQGGGMQTPSGTGSVGIIPWDGEIIPSSDTLPRLRRDTGADGVDSSEKEKGVQRTVLILAVAAAALVLASGG